MHKLKQMKSRKMSEITSDVEMECGKRQTKLTAKAWAHKIEKLQHERKITVNKMKVLIPEMKALMKQKENASHVQCHMDRLIQLCENATKLHDELIPLLVEDEQNKQNEWFSSIMKYSNAFKEDVHKWLSESEGSQLNNSLSQSDPTAINEEVLQCPTEEDEPPVTTQAASIINTEDVQDDIKPSDSVSNVGSRNSATEGRSPASASSARLKVEVDLAVLMTRQKLLKDKHELEEQEEQLKRKKEQLKLDEAIAEHMAKLNVLRSSSILSGKNSISRHSDGMNSYLEKGKSKPGALNANANSFIPQMTEKQKETKHDYLHPGTRPKENTVPQLLHYEPVSLKESKQHSVKHRVNDNSQTQYKYTLNAGFGSGDEDQNNMLGIMRKQNEITTLLIQQQCLSSLPRREISVFDGDPLKYHAFIKAFENGVERNTENYSDRLYFLEQYTRGHPKELVRSCQHFDSERGYVKAKALLREHFGNAQKVASAYMERALSWPPIKTEDVKALQDYSLFLRSCSNAMEGVEYLHELDMPANMLTIIRKLPYKFRDKWRTVACELQERRNQRATFSNITDFIERQLKILTDPVFGNIQDAPPVTINKGVNKFKLQPRSGMKGTSFATTVASVENKTQPATKGKEQTFTARRMCLCCGGEHTLETCNRLEKRTHKEKIGFLKENGVCFGCLCIGHISKDCKKTDFLCKMWSPTS